MTEQPITPRRDPIVTTEAIIQRLEEHQPTRLDRLEAAARIIDVDLAAHPDHDQDGRFLALDALRGFITDQRDAAEDDKVAAFYEGQYAAESREVVVSFSALPSEDKRVWRRKFQAAAATVR